MVLPTSTKTQPLKLLAISTLSTYRYHSVPYLWTQVSDIPTEPKDVACNSFSSCPIDILTLLCASVPARSRVYENITRWPVSSGFTTIYRLLLERDFVVATRGHGGA